MEWRPAKVEEVQDVIQCDLVNCDAEQLMAFRQYAVQPYCAPILRYGKKDQVVVVARKGNEVIYWEDIEEGFNVSPVAEDGQVLEHWCDQNELRFALNSWIEDRPGRAKLGPAVTVK